MEDQKELPPEGVDGGEGDAGGEDQGQQEKTIPIERFNKVYGDFKRYSDLGKLDEVQSKLQKLEQYERAIEEHRKQQGLSTQDKDAQETAARIRKQLLEVYPELGRLSELDRLDAFEERQVALNMKEASLHLGGLLKENNIKASPEVQDKLEDFILSQMTEEQVEEFTQGDFSVVDGILKTSLEMGFLDKWKTRGSEPPKPPARHTPGGMQQQKGDKKPRTFDEATSAAYEALQAAKAAKE